MSDRMPGSGSDVTSRGGDTRREERPNARTGSVVAGRYEVDKLIARGGMATVYLAHQVGLERKVALKILAPPPDADDAAAFETRFHLEARSLASLNHSNIVTVYDFGETDDGRFYLAMEHIDGPKFSDLLRDGPLAVQRAIPLIMQVCVGLRYAHKRHVVHRDLKPSNILIKQLDDGQPLVKLVDFGLVKLTVDDQTITRAGLILGSPHCMAPEQVRGVEVDERADIYAVGVLLFRSLTGHYPFHGPNSAATMIAHLNEPVPAFYSVAPQVVVPEGLEDIVRRCLAKAATDRFQSMSDVMDALAACMHYAPNQSYSHSSMAQRTSGLRSVPSALAQGPTAIHPGPSGGFSRPSGAFPSPQASGQHSGGYPPPPHHSRSGAHPAPAQNRSGSYPSPSGGYQSPSRSYASLPSQPSLTNRSGPRPPVVYSEPSNDYGSGVRIGVGGATPVHVDPGRSGYRSGAYPAPQPRSSGYPLMLMAFGVGVTMFLSTLVLGAFVSGAFGPNNPSGLQSSGALDAPAAAAATEAVAAPTPAAPTAAAPPPQERIPVAPAPRRIQPRPTAPAPVVQPAEAGTPPARPAEAPPVEPEPLVEAIGGAAPKPPPQPDSAPAEAPPEGLMSNPY